VATQEPHFFKKKKRGPEVARDARHSKTTHPNKKHNPATTNNDKNKPKQKQTNAKTEKKSTTTEQQKRSQNRNKKQKQNKNLPPLHHFTPFAHQNLSTSPKPPKLGRLPGAPGRSEATAFARYVLFRLLEGAAGG